MIQWDQVETLDNAVIQHGKLNDRIYLMELNGHASAELPGKLSSLAGHNGYSKIFGKVPAPAAEPFLGSGYKPEAKIPGFFQGSEEAVFVSRFLSRDRAVDPQLHTRQEILGPLVGRKQPRARRRPLPPGFTCERAEPGDAADVAQLYRQVFATYPFPIHKEEYIRRTMADNVVYFRVRRDGQTAALASCEINRHANSVEMTDFATLPTFRGNGIAQYLLAAMEDEMRRQSVQMSYTIARAVSYGMNAVFAKAGYRFGGTLVNNTNICGRLESMNIWYKPL